jgi:hypothetical protein
MGLASDYQRLKFIINESVCPVGHPHKKLYLSIRNTISGIIKSNGVTTISRFNYLVFCRIVHRTFLDKTIRNYVSSVTGYSYR